jgi:hypothetical protein
MPWVEVTNGPAPGVGLYTLLAAEGRLYYAYQRRQIGSDVPASSNFQTHCVRQK